ncbi:hypothetical protein Tco_0069600 [Tanacetum coccineum]
MVLSSTYLMPPKRYPQHIEEKMAAIANQFAELVDILSSLNARLETFSQKFTSQTTFTKNESNTKTDDITVTTTDYVVIETSSLVTKINKPDNSMVRFLSDSTVENKVCTQIPFSPVFDEPPWEPHERRYKSMSLGFRSGHEPGFAKRDPPWGIFLVNGDNLGLEDKAVFQDGSIDTFRVS